MEGSGSGNQAHDNFGRRSGICQRRNAGNIVAVPGHNGYWVVTGEKIGLGPALSSDSGSNETGTLYARGDAPLICGPNDGDSLSKCSGYNPTNAKVVGAAATPDGRGLWALDSNGAVWTAGTAKSYGDVRKKGSKPEEIVELPFRKGLLHLYGGRRCV